MIYTIYIYTDIIYYSRLYYIPGQLFTVHYLINSHSRLRIEAYPEDVNPATPAAAAGRESNPPDAVRDRAQACP